MFSKYLALKRNRVLDLITKLREYLRLLKRYLYLSKAVVSRDHRSQHYCQRQTHAHTRAHTHNSSMILPEWRQNY